MRRGNTSLGGVQPAGSPEPAGGWRWITGEPFSYTNWTPGQPNNNEASLNGGENRIQFGGLPGMVATWNDLNETNRGYARSFVIEYDADWGTGCLPAPLVNVSRQDKTHLWLDVAGAPGINYALERTDAFGQWTRFATNRSSSGLVRFTYPILPATPPQFFRALSVNSADGLGGSFIFDGQTYTGWTGDTISAFRLQDCSIVGSIHLI